MPCPIVSPYNRDASKGRSNIKVKGNIIGGDGALRRNLDGNFLQGLDVLDFVDDRNEDSKTGLQDTVEFPHALDEPGLLLRNETATILREQAARRCCRPLVQRFKLTG